MKKILNALLLLTSFFGYLEWGGGNHSFIFQSEAEIFAKAANKPLEVLHPFTLIPFIGQLLLLITLFQSAPNRVLTLAGTACLSTIMLFLFFIGIISLNLKVLGSTIPFLIVAVLIFRQYSKKIPKQKQAP